MKRSGFSGKKGFKQRSGLKNRSGFSDRKTSPKRKKPLLITPRQKEVQRLDRIFSMYIRISYANPSGNVKCFTCDRIGFWKNGGIECGHYRSRSNIATRWFEPNAHPQCIYCNQVLNGNMDKYRQELVTKYGGDILEMLDRKAETVENLSVEELRKLRLSYQNKLKQLRNDRNT